MTDWVRIALYLAGVAALVLIVCLLIVGFANSGSRNISLAIGTVFGAHLASGSTNADEVVTQLIAILDTQKLAAAMNRVVADPGCGWYRKLRGPTEQLRE